jgi:NAD+ synthase (glutamine-hydrolysing)
MYMADEGNYRESRWFNCWTRAGQVEEHPLPGFLHRLQRSAPFGDAVLQFEDTNVAAEICEELFAPMSPHLALAIAGNVEIFLNGSASHHELGKLKRRFDLILGATAKVGGLYLYANQMGCDGDRLYFDGSAIISLNGHLLAQSPQFSPEHVHVVTATVDLDLIQILRGTRPSFTSQAANANSLFPFQYAIVKVEGVHLCWQRGECSGLSGDVDVDRISNDSGLGNRFSELPRLTPTIEPQFHAPGAEVALGPALWLWDYLKKSGAGGFFLPLSGGLDSCSCALVVFSMAKVICSNLDSADVRRDLQRLLSLKTADKESHTEIEALRKDPRLLMNRLLFTAYLGTRYSSDSSNRRAESLARLINA